ncbi:MAG TPA: ATP-binding protein [Thermoanaerobaculia bacterium]|nr:ATP-binding protein [Thermoanaerobaculia bacterium]
MYVRSLQIENLRCFQSAEIELQYPGRSEDEATLLPNVNLLLGENGAGKSTVLKAIALTVLRHIIAGSGFVPYHLVRRERRGTDLSVEAEIAARLILDGQDAALIKLIEEGSLETGARLGLKRVGSQEQLIVPLQIFSLDYRDESVHLWERLFDDSSPAFLLVGYGATRYVLDSSQFEPLPSQRKRRSLRYQRVAGLFEDHLGLSPLGSWLPRVAHESSERFAEITDLLNQLLPDEARFLGEMEDEEYLFDHCGVRVPLGALSDGYRAYVGWVSDLLYTLSHGAPAGTSLRDARGVVLVDEIDLHLHPEWQREVIPTVARTLPNLQFVFTTHSPIVAGTLNAGNIFVLEMDGQGASTIRQLEEPIHGLNADQILLSSYFNLDSTRAPEAVDELRDLSRRAMSGDPKAALNFLEKITNGTEPSPAPKTGTKKTSRRSRVKIR